MDPPYVNTTKAHIYALDGDATVRMLGLDGSMTQVTSVAGTAKARAAFAVSPDDSQIAVGVIDFSTSSNRLYVEKLGGGAHVDLFTTTTGPFYWPVRWRNGKIVLASGSNGEVLTNPYNATGYAIIDPVAGARPVPLGKGDCIPSGTLTAAGTACIVLPGTQCLEGVVANAVSPYYYNSCLRRIGWDGTETTFLLPKNDYTSSFVVNNAALSTDGQQIMTDTLGRVEAPSSATHGGNTFLGPTTSTFRIPGRPCMGWIDPSVLSFTYVNPDGSTDVRLLGAGFSGSTDIAPGVPSSPVNGDLVGTVPDEFDR